MYERFTDRARKVMQLANQEAQRFNHEYIDTQHVLLGIVKEGSGIAANALKNLDVDLRKIRLEVEKLVETGPDMVTMGKMPQTPAAKRAVEAAMDAARKLNHNYVGTEHLLLGLLENKETIASQVLEQCGVKVEELREEVMQLTATGAREPRDEPKSQSSCWSITQTAEQVHTVTLSPTELNQVWNALSYYVKYVRKQKRRTREEPIAAVRTLIEDTASSALEKVSVELLREPKEIKMYRAILEVRKELETMCGEPEAIQ